jgi:hypothetical protein
MRLEIEDARKEGDSEIKDEGETEEKDEEAS